MDHPEPSTDDPLNPKPLCWNICGWLSFLGHLWIILVCPLITHSHKDPIFGASVNSGVTWDIRTSFRDIHMTNSYTDSIIRDSWMSKQLGCHRCRFHDICRWWSYWGHPWMIPGCLQATHSPSNPFIRTSVDDGVTLDIRRSSWVVHRSSTHPQTPLSEYPRMVEHWGHFRIFPG